MPPGTGELRTLKVGYIPITDLLGMYAAIEQGFFQQAGYKVELQSFSGGAAIVPALAGGSLDIGAMNYLAAVQARSQGLGVRIVSDSSFDTKANSAFAIGLRKDSGITTASGLNGKTVAVNTRNGIAHIGVMEWMERNGGDPRSVVFTELPLPQAPAAIANRVVDAAVLAEPFMTVALQQGAVVLANYFAELADPIAVAPFGAMDDWIQRNLSAARAFHEANARGIGFVKANDAVARQYVVKYCGITPELAPSIRLATLYSTAPPGSVQIWIDLAKKWGLIPTNSDIRVQDLTAKL